MSAGKSMTSQESPSPERAAAPQADGLLQRPWILGAVMFTVFALVFALGMTFGYGWGRSVAQAAATTPEQAEQEALGVKGELSPAFDLFWEAMELLYRDFNG